MGRDEQNGECGVPRANRKGCTLFKIRIGRSALCILFAFSSACADERAEPLVDSASAITVVDSLLPIEEEIRRFRLDVPEVPTGLTGGEDTRDALVKRWVDAVERRDSVALERMLMTAAEYITFYYPESPYIRPPYRQKPSLRWFLISSSSSQGLARVWQRHAGSPLGYSGYRCAAQPELQGYNRIWHDCVLRFRETGGERQLRLFGPIIEREGRFKFLSYSSDY